MADNIIVTVPRVYTNGIYSFRLNPNANEIDVDMSQGGSWVTVTTFKKPTGDTSEFRFIVEEDCSCELLLQQLISGGSWAGSEGVDFDTIEYFSGGAYEDYDGNQYDSVIIGNQEWLIQNLKTTHYADGTAIPNLTADVAWNADTTGAYCWYDNDIGYKCPYGALYNWYAVDNASGLVYFTKGGVVQTGWRIPTYADMLELGIDLGGASVAGGLMKEGGTTHWNSPNVGATNASGFTGLPGGCRDSVSGFINFYADGFWWLSDTFPLTTTTTTTTTTGTTTVPDEAFQFYLYNTDADLFIQSMVFNFGASIRCVKTIGSTTTEAPM